MTTTEREFDIIIWGATGFTGRLTAEYLLERYGLSGSLRWAIGGRSQSKLEETRSSLETATGISTESLPIHVADANDAAGMRTLASRTSVVASTVGPYALYGDHLVAACADLGTHYCDLTGEVHWMRRMIDAHETRARESGARIVFTCGFDCIPSDLGTFFLQNEMQARHGLAAAEIKFRVKSFKGGASGGTIASMINMFEFKHKENRILHPGKVIIQLHDTIETKGMSRAELKGLSDRVHDIISKPIEEAMVDKARLEAMPVTESRMRTRF